MPRCPGGPILRRIDPAPVIRKKKIAYRWADSYESDILRTRLRRGGNPARCRRQATELAKLLIYGLFRKIRVLAQDAMCRSAKLQLSTRKVSAVGPRVALLGSPDPARRRGPSEAGNHQRAWSNPDKACSEPPHDDDVNSRSYQCPTLSFLLVDVARASQCRRHEVSVQVVPPTLLCPKREMRNLEALDDDALGQSL